MSIYRLNVTIIKYFLDLQSQSKKRQSVVPKHREVDSLGKRQSGGIGRHVGFKIQ